MIRVQRTRHTTRVIFSDGFTVDITRWMTRRSAIAAAMAAAPVSTLCGAR